MESVEGVKRRVIWQRIVASSCKQKPTLFAESEGVVFIAGRHQSVDARPEKLTFKLDFGANLVNDKTVLKSLEILEQPVVIGAA